jgi:hypothetical protein
MAEDITAHEIKARQLTTGRVFLLGHRIGGGALGRNQYPGPENRYR